MDTEYLQKHLGPCLVNCLTEVSQKRPHDPIEFMAQWLYKHIDNEIAAKQDAEDCLELEMQRIEQIADQEREAKMREEKIKLAQEEAERKKAEEALAITAQGLPSLVEEETSDTGRTAEEKEAEPATTTEEGGEEQPSEEDGGEGEEEASGEGEQEAPTEGQVDEGHPEEETPREETE